MTEQPDPSVFEEPAHQPPPQHFIDADEVRAEPALSPPGGPSDPRNAPAEEPALSSMIGLPTYGDVYEELRDDTSNVEFRSAAVIAGSLAFISGMILVPVVIVGHLMWGPLLAVLLLAAPTLALVERRPWQVSSYKVALVIPLVTTLPVWAVAFVVARTAWVGRLTGLVFAVAVTLAAVVLGIGMADVWRGADHDHRPPTFRRIVPHAVAALVTVFLGMIGGLALAL